MRMGTSDDGCDIRAEAVAVEADAQLHARGRGDAARAGVDPGRRTGRLFELASITEARGAELQGRSGAASRETLEPESAGHRSYTREARGLRRQFRSAGGQQAPACKPEQLRGGSGCPTRVRRQAPSAGLRP